MRGGLVGVASPVNLPFLLSILLLMASIHLTLELSRPSEDPHPG